MQQHKKTLWWLFLNNGIFKTEQDSTKQIKSNFSLFGYVNFCQHKSLNKKFLNTNKEGLKVLTDGET